jgi:branched-chain amino acid transport system permease protein
VATDEQARPGERLVAMLARPDDAETAAFGVEVSGASRAFGGNQAVDRASMRVLPRAIHGVIGPNGSGKTTLLNLISGYYPMDEGRIAIGGIEVSGRNATQIARLGVARTFQQPRLMDAETVLDNVLLGTYRMTEATLAEWLLRLGRARREDQRHRADARECLAFLRMDHLAEVPVRQLAHGQRRLVEIARALASRPRLLLLDEPAAGLPPNQVDRLASVITAVRALDITVLLVEHHIEMVINLVDSLTVMHQGRVLAEGPVREVIELPDVLTAYVGKVDTGRLVSHRRP